MINPHGLSGKELSSVFTNFLRTYLNKHIEHLSTLKSEFDVEEFLREIYQHAHESLLRNGIDLNFSGGSATTVMIFNNFVFTAWLGNSRVVLY